MKSAQRGNRTLAVEIGNISKHGFWILIGDVEYFLAFSRFPWFREVSIGQLLNVELPHPHHLYWPDMDVDLAVDSIIHPEKYPLVSRMGAQTLRSRTGSRKRIAKKTRR